MSYRVYDVERKEWVKDNIYLTPDDGLFKIKQSVFGLIKVPLELSLDRYIYHRDIGLYDKNGVLIYEGDHLEAEVAEDRVVTGVVVYASEIAGYIILCNDTDEFFSLGSDICEYIKVVGNVFDNAE